MIFASDSLRGGAGGGAAAGVVARSSVRLSTVAAVAGGKRRASDRHIKLAEYAPSIASPQLRTAPSSALLPRGGRLASGGAVSNGARTPRAVHHFDPIADGC